VTVTGSMDPPASGSSSATRLNYADLALRYNRPQFLLRAVGPFLVSTDPWARPFMPRKTDAMLDTRTGLRDLPSGSLSVMVIQKNQSAFGNMITVGRTSNNDIVVDDSHISRFHAFFRPQGDGFELADAGSRNGTWWGDRRMDPKDFIRLKPNDVVRFAGLAFVFVDAAGCWEFIRKAVGTTKGAASVRADPVR
jgi:hypothetical protein